MPPTLEQVLAELATAQKTFVDDFKTYRTAMEKDILVREARYAALEESIKSRLVGDHGPTKIPESRWSWARVAYSVAAKDWSYAPFERAEIDKYREKATMQAGAFAVGGSLIPPQYMAELIELLRQNLIVEQLGVRMITGLTQSPVMIPKLTGGVTASWIGEGAAAPETNITTGRLDMQPHKLAALCKMSNDLVLLSNPGIEATVRADLVRGMSGALQTSFFTGVGTLGEPVGVKNAGITTFTPATAWVAVAGADTIAEIQTNIASLTGMVKQLENDKALKGNIRWVCNPTTFWALASMSDTAGHPFLINPSGNFQLIPAPAPQMFGYPILRSTVVSPAATDNLYIGNWDDVILAMWSDMAIVGSTDASTAFTNDELWIRAILRADVGVRQAKSIVIHANAIN